MKGRRFKMSEEIESLIRFMTDEGGRVECAASEKVHPKPEIREEDAVKRAVKEMLIENTGCSILDSGGAYGRGWEKNRSRNFDEEEAVFLEVYGDNIEISYNIYWYLVNFLSISEESERLNTKLQTIFNESEKLYSEDIEDFVAGEENLRSEGSENTYNYETILSEIIQYNILIDEETDEYFIILQIHNGCDVRGGYTRPRVFSLGEDDAFSYFCIAQHDINAYCEKCRMTWYSDDSGYTWEGEKNYTPQEELKVGVESEKELLITTDEKNNLVKHKNCGGKITYSVTESW